MHTILGAGGPIANALTTELVSLNQIKNIRLVSRRPVATHNPKVQWHKADLTQAAEVMLATKESSVIYLCAGLVYDKDVWQQQWPVIAQNVINAAKENNARLIFFDNVYMYGLVNGPMLESTPYNPVSKKGEVRARIATQLMEEAKAGNLQATIGRAADFYGAESMNSFLDSMVLAEFAKSQKAMWLGKAQTKHCFTYVPDAGKAMALLGQHPEHDNQIWHLPTAPALTGLDFLEIAASVFGTKPRYMTVNKLMLQLIGMFNKVIQGTVEMYYQYDHDYIFDSTRFEKAFNVQPTPYADGILHLSKTLFRQQ
ncbi:NAD-dependent epimerase/dehydratase family protein [Mucilaginibacter sp. PAMB04274]|uniref:NAD-dependent epimerase/dehydratase family protein n=1 Tax=Mucilaginibacter sp. PAMB04274 TaxID=3138568 RepID=UPI0031F5F224